MKKVIALFLSMMFVGASAYAGMTPDQARQAHRKEMKAVKDAQREARKNKPAVAPGDKKPSLWEKEGVRSGLSETGASINTFIKGLNPVPFFREQDRRYKERKTAAMAGAVK